MLQPSDLSRALLRYCEPNMRHALFEVAVTLIPLVLLWVLMWLSLDVGSWLTLLLAAPAGGVFGSRFIIPPEPRAWRPFPHPALEHMRRRLVARATQEPCG